MPYEIRQISPRRYEVRNMLTGKIHAKHTSLKKAKQQVNILHTGEGIGGGTADYLKRKIGNVVSDVGRVGNYVSDFGKKVIYGRQGLSPKVNKILQEMGDAVIQSATVGRSPVQSFITNIIKVVSTTPYEKLFHLFIILHTTKGDVLLEKNEVINMDKGGAPKNSELIQVPSVPAGLTVQQLIDNTAKYMGNNFIPYAAGHNNCQDFMMGILTSNNMLTPELKTFVKQDTTDIFKSPWFRKFAHTVTDIAGRANVIMQGGGTDLIVGGQNETTDAELLEILKKVKSFHGCFVKDEEAEIRHALRNDGFVIINLNGQSHWCVLGKEKKLFCWFDPFGFPSPLEIENIIPYDYVYSNDEIQCINTTSCGFYCVAFIKFMDKYGLTIPNYKKFQHIFKKTPQHNEAILAELLKKLN